jgi:hypothetical protein
MTVNIRHRIPRILVCLAILTGTTFLCPVQRCFADSFNYKVSESVYLLTPQSGEARTLLGTVTGDFTISTAGVPFNYGNGYGTPNYTYSCDGDTSPFACPLVSSASLTWTPQGGNGQHLGVSPFIGSLLGADEGFDAVGLCAFASGEYCEFQLFAQNASIRGLLDFSGHLGQDLTMGLCAGCFGSSYPNFFTTYQGTVVATPEPGAFVLAFCGLILLLARRLS